MLLIGSFEPLESCLFVSQIGKDILLSDSLSRAKKSRESQHFVKRQTLAMSRDAMSSVISGLQVVFLLKTGRMADFAKRVLRVEINMLRLEEDVPQWRT